MKKSTKLLSVILAIVMIFSSMSVMASAAKASYKTVADLDANDAYSPYGTVTRLSTEERMSILFDYLDGILADANINMGQLISIGLIESNKFKINVDLRSVDALCGTVDSLVHSVRHSTYWGVAKGLVGVLGDLKVTTWTEGMTREGTAQLTIVRNLLALLDENRGLVNTVLSNGLDLGIVSSFVDLSSVQNVIKDIPGLIKGMIYPLFTRWDDTTARADQLANTAGNGGLEATLNEFVQRLFTNNMSITTYVEDANGNCVSNHTLPMAEGTRWYFTRGTAAKGEYLQLSSYDAEKKAYVTEEENRYFKTLEEQDEDYEGPDRYVYTKTNADGSKENLKYYKNDSQFLPSFAAAMAAGTASIDLTKDTPAELLYRFIPYVFAEMAPTVLNGSVKKLFAGLLGAKFTYIGEVGSAEVNALADASDVFFTQEQGEYLWEWSDYKVINGNHYYRFEDSIYAGDINDVNKYFSLINWDWKVEDNAINEFIPGGNGTTKSAAGYSTIFQALNDFVAKVIDIAATPELKTLMGWEKGDNSKLVDNIKRAARALLPIEPEIIFGSNYQDPNKYYDLIMTATDNQEILVGVACTLLDFLMPQLILPTADTIKGSGVKLGAVLAAVIRELATQFLPTYNYDDLIYANYDNKTFVAGKDNGYWLDVCLTMGTDIGMSYLRNLADLGEDDATNGYKFAASKTYTLANFDQTGWEDTIDWVLDWALSDQYEWCWSMIKFVDTYEDIDLATAQDPWAKIGDILNSLLPINILLNVDTSKSDWAKTALRENLVMGILDLDFTRITGSTEANGLFNVPVSSVLRTTPTLTAVVSVIRDVLNNALSKVAGGNLIDPSIFTGIDTLLNQGNLATFVSTLLNKLLTAYDNGLLVPVMPILGFFVGWTTDAQKMVDPQSRFENTNGRDYITSVNGTANTTFKVTNKSSGMLLRHRANASVNKNFSGVTDHAYTITINSITSDDASMTGGGTNLGVNIEPGATADFPLSFTYSGDRTVAITIKYNYVGKGGKALGGEQTKVVYQFISNITPDSELGGRQAGDDDKDYTGIDEWNKYVFTKNLYSTVVNYSQTISYKSATVYNPKKNFNYVKAGTAMTAPASDYFAIITDRAEAGWAASLSKNEVSTGKLYKAINGTNEDTKFNYGLYDLGAVYLRYGTSDDKVWDPDFIYYNDFNIDDVVKDYEGRNLNAENIGTGAGVTEAFNRYATALANAKRLSVYPFMKDYVETIQPQIEPAIEELKAAYDALAKAMGQASSSASDVYDVPQVLLDDLNTVEPGGDVPEINYQDYELFEYFKYHDQRNAVRNRINAYYGPVAPEKYIEGSSLTAEEIDALVAGASAKKALGIENTVQQPSKQALKDYRNAKKNWTVPTYADLNNASLGRLLVHYKQFLIKKTTEKQFLAKEIAYANAQNYNEAIYAADSWAAYQSALANAVAVNNDSNALQSTVFDAKYELMKAQNELLRKDRSVKELGLLTELEALVAQAETIFNYSQYYAPKANITEADAYGALIKALGYTYTDKDGNEQILYNRSAAEFLKYDRENTATGLARVAAAEAALKAAIDNFECTVKLVENDGDTTTEVAQGVKIINGITPGSIASIDALMNHVKASAENAVATPTASASGFFGTGAKVDLSIEGIGVLTTYYVVIYGDVNGDGAIDAFDAAVVNQNINTGATLNGVYKDAAMVTSGDDVELADYSAIFNAAVGAQEIDQNRA